MAVEAAESGSGDEDTRLPVAYHDKDFAWESLRDKVQPLLAQRAAAAAANSNLAEHQDDGSSWEAFHMQHSSARFFRPKRYLVAEFPALLAPGVHILDIGAGNGASILPVLAANPTARATCCDLSATSLRLLAAAAGQAGTAAERLDTLVLDAAADDAATTLAGRAADAALLVFALSAVAPQRMAAVLQLAKSALRPGGLLLFRDYGLYDMLMLRFPPGQRLGPALFCRKDGTLASFFSVEEVEALAEAAGFAVQDCRYGCVNNVNRKSGAVLQRVFVHGVFQRQD